MNSILERIRMRGCVLMLDFDGTLSPTVSDHRVARISKSTRASLRNAARRFPAAVISGRALSDVRSRIRLPISCAGSHGLESRITGMHSKKLVEIPCETRKAFLRAKHALVKVVRGYKGVRIENKGLSFAAHYRALSRAKRKLFARDAMAILHSRF